MFLARKFDSTHISPTYLQLRYFLRYITHVHYMIRLHTLEHTLLIIEPHLNPVAIFIHVAHVLAQTLQLVPSLLAPLADVSPAFP